MRKVTCEDKNLPRLIRDYGYISDCHSSALVSNFGSIDWCCLPRVDSASCFGRLLDWKKGGYFQICPTEKFKVSRSYLDKTMILETIFETARGTIKLLDFYTMKEGGKHHPHAQILRVIECIKGSVEVEVNIEPRFDYGTIKPWIRKYKLTGYMALGGDHGLLFSSSKELNLKNRHHLQALFTLKKNERVFFSMLYRKPEELDYLLIEVPSVDELDSRLKETIAWWYAWSNKGNFSGKNANLIERSALVLKSLTYSPTGAIAAAPTTSLPESLGSNRNWDYRFSWIRDSYFCVKTLTLLGYVNEADRFRRFIERSSQGTAKDLQTLFGVTGQRRLTEFLLPNLQGYQHSKPVRIGNAAVSQLQLDMYGYLVDLAWNWLTLGSSPDTDYWYFLEHIIESVIKQWEKPDCGIWEVRGKPKHFVYSKLMCWVAIDRGIKIALDQKYQVNIKKWQKVCNQIRKAIEEQGYDKKRGVFVQAFDSNLMDSSLLCLPIFGFIDFNDKRMIRTTELIRKELGGEILLKRYQDNSDGLEGVEGTFLACSFWLVICLANQKKIREANHVFNKAISTVNDLGLFSEEYDSKQNEMLGNFPQAFTHLTFIQAALELNKIKKN